MNLTAPPGRITGPHRPERRRQDDDRSTPAPVWSSRRPARCSTTAPTSPALSPPARARQGLGRTFQQVELWPSLTVRGEHRASGREAPDGGGNSSASSSSPRRASRTDGGHRQGGDGAHRHRPHRPTESVSDLSTGEKRLVELARVLAGPFDRSCSTSPARASTRPRPSASARCCVTVVDTRGSGVLLVEHDMLFVTQVCDYIYVIDFGHLIFEGTPPRSWAAKSSAPPTWEPR